MGLTNSPIFFVIELNVSNSKIRMLHIQTIGSVTKEFKVNL